MNQQGRAAAVDVTRSRKREFKVDEFDSDKFDLDTFDLDMFDGDEFEADEFDEQGLGPDLFEFDDSADPADFDALAEDDESVVLAKRDQVLLRRAALADAQRTSTAKQRPAGRTTHKPLRSEASQKRVGSVPVQAGRPTGALRIQSGDRLRLLLLGGVGFLAVALVLLRLKGGGGAAAPTIAPPIDESVAASGSVFAEDLLIELTKTAGVRNATASFVPGVGPVVSLQLVDVLLDDLSPWLADVLVAVGTKVPTALATNQAIFVVQATGSEQYARTIVVPVASLDDPSAFSLSSAASRAGSGMPAELKQAPTSAPAMVSSVASVPTLAPSTVAASTGQDSVPATTTGSPTTAVPVPASGSPDAAAPAVPTTTAAVAGTAAATATPDGAVGVVERFDSTASAWKPLAGQWRVADGVYQQLDNSGFDFISQFGPALPASFELSAKFASQADLNAGFMIFQPKKGSRNNSVLVDLTDKGSYVRWGHYDRGGVYVFDGGNKLAAPVDAAKGIVLKVTYANSVVRIYIDDKQVGEFTPSEVPTGPTYSGIVSSVTTYSVDDVLLAAR